MVKIILENKEFEIEGEVLKKYLGGGEEAVVPEGITKIGADSFKDCVRLKRIRLPDSVREIGDGAFQHCVSLEHIDLPSNLEKIGRFAFNSCSNLKEIVFPDKLTHIGDVAFCGCTSFRDVAVPETVKTVGEAIFGGNYVNVYCEAKEKPDGWDGQWNYTGYKRMNVFWGQDISPVVKRLEERKKPKADVLEYDKSQFIINGTVLEKYIGKSQDIIVPQGVTEIEYRAFYDYSMKSVTLPDSVEKIHEEAFKFCKDLEEIVFPRNLKIIGENSFESCRSLKKAIFPCGLEKICDNAFEQCISLKNIKLYDKLTYIGKFAFWGCKFTSFTVPSGVRTIGSCAFGYCEKLKKVIIPSGVDEIGYGAFDKCPYTVAYCESSGKPSGWNKDWDRRTLSGYRIKVVWGFGGKTLG